MVKFIFVFLVVFFSACTSTLPAHKKEISSFIPKEKTFANIIVEDFAAKNFPKKCKWFEIKSVSDGDTIVLGDNTRVRFIGIDTPETVHPKKPIQFCGPEASSWTKKVFKDDKKVCLIFDSLSDKRDKYGRRLAYPFTEDGIDTTAELLKLGLARGYFYFPFSRKKEFRFYHDVAKNFKKGVWSKREEVKECEIQTTNYKLQL